MAELSTLQKAYREFFRALMDEYGISSPVQLKTAEKRKEFFNRIKSEWPAVKRSLKEHYLRLQIRKMIMEELNEAKKPAKGTLYILNSSIFDSNKYDSKLYTKILKSVGAKKVWMDNKWGWSNQPEVVLFTGITKEEAADALESQVPIFKKWGAIIGDANHDWNMNELKESKRKYPPGDHYTKASKALASNKSVVGMEQGYIAAQSMISKNIEKELKKKKTPTDKKGNFVVPYSEYEKIVQQFHDEEDKYIKAKGLYKKEALNVV